MKLALIFIWGIAFIMVALTGCAQTVRSDQNEQQDRVMVRETEEVRQEVHEGQIIELRSFARVTEKEQTDKEARRDERSEVEAPKVLDILKPAAQKVADAIVPGGGAAVDWIWQAIAGVGATGAAGAAGVAMRERTRRRQLIAAQDAYARDVEQAETDDQIKEIKRKHADRQKALGIYDQLTRERHGA